MDDDGNFTVKFREKGSRSINDTSQMRQDGVSTIPGQFKHQVCRMYYTKSKSLHQTNFQIEALASPRTLRSGCQKIIKVFKEHGLICGKFAKLCDKKRAVTSFLFELQTFRKRERERKKNVEKENDNWAKRGYSLNRIRICT